MNNKLSITYLILIIAPLFFGCGGPVTAENKNATASSVSPGQVNFSGEWKLNESKSKIGGKFPLCIFGGDRMRSKTMKIAHTQIF